jgi:CheY-like chemotaxis protein
VLVVDDEKLPRRAVSRWLGGLGLDVVAVASAAEALELLANERFDVVVADWMLEPPERGDHLLDEIKDRYPHMRRVLFSGRDVNDASSAHFFISKPSSVETLERALREHALGMSPFNPGGSDEPN